MSDLAPQQPTLEDLLKEFDIFVRSAEEQERVEQSLTPEQNANIEQYISGLPELRDRIGKLMDRLALEEEMDKRSAARYAARAATYRRMQEWIKFSLKSVMDVKGYKKIEGKEYTFSIKKNPPSVAIVNDRDVPAEYCELTLVPKKEDIKAALEAGIEVTGCVLVKDKTRLEIK